MAELNEESKDLIRSSLRIEKNILNFSLLKWASKLKKFEDDNNMSSKEFINKFENGGLGDDKKWFEWLSAYKAYNHIKNKLKIINGIIL